MDTQEVEFSRKLEKEKSLLNIMMLVPHKRYLVSIKVQSAGMSSEVVEGSTITMIDRKCFLGGTPTHFPAPVAQLGVTGMKETQKVSGRCRPFWMPAEQPSSRHRKWP